MKAVVYTKYGPPEVLRLTDIAKPQPGINDVLIKVYASTVNRTDCGYRSAQYVVSRLVTGLVRPKHTTTGSEFAGQIVEVGDAVTNYLVGDKVFGFDDVRGGAHAEYMVKPADGPFTTMPEGFGYEKLAPAGEGATYALNVIHAVAVQPGQKVMVYGASGAIGSAAVQILKHLGADVTAVCGTKNVGVVRSLGPDRVIDYETEDFTNSGPFDFVFDAVGKSSYGVCRHLLTPRGTYYSTELGKGGQNPLLALWFGLRGSRRVIFPIPNINREVIEHIKHLIALGAFRPLIDRTSYELDDIVEATKYVETGQKTGNLVIKIGS